MSRTYTPGPEADAIVEQLLATGNYPSADEIVLASLQLLQASEPESEAELEELRRLIAEGDAAYARGATAFTSTPRNSLPTSKSWEPVNRPREADRHDPREA